MTSSAQTQAVTAVETHADSDPRGNRALEIDEQSFTLRRFWLVFRDPGVEKRFTDESFVQSLNFIRAYLIAGTTLYGVFGLLDSIVGGSATTAMLVIRYGIVCPILVGIFVLTFFPLFMRVGQYALATAMISSGLGVSVMTAIMPPPFNSEYYAGLIMVVIYCGSLIRLKFIYAVLISIFLTCTYQISAGIINPIPMREFISNNFFLVMATAVGLFSGYIQELYIRRTYANSKIIEMKNEITNVLLRESTQVNRAKNEFLANMSHELRTPLNAVIGFSDILKGEMFGPLGSDKYKDYVADINDSGKHLLSIINDVLMLTDVESGKIDLRGDELEVRQVLLDCMDKCADRARAGRVKLTLTQTGTPGWIVADARLLYRAVLNVVSNAVKFTPEGGEVRLTYAVSPVDGVLLEIADTGIGIKAEDVARILKPFEQVESAYARKNQGTGLGLPLAVKLVELHGGKLTVKSVLNQGTVVSIQLPPGRVSLRHAQPQFAEAV